MSTSKYVIVRTYSAGVHCGVLVAREGREVTLTEARRIWRWAGAYTLSEIATGSLDTEKSKISAPVGEIVLTEAIEIITCAPEGAAKLRGATWATGR